LLRLPRCRNEEGRPGQQALTIDAPHLDLLIKVHDAVRNARCRRREPPAEAKAAFVKELDAKLSMAMTRTGTGQAHPVATHDASRFRNTLQDLLALPRLDVVGLLPGGWPGGGL